jgi:two-component system LytT family response regulator
MKVALIDDEVDARKALRALLQQEMPSAIIEEATSIATGLTLIKSSQPDIVFLDIMMKDGTGFDLLKQLPAINFKLVIVSGHDEFALQAFRFSAIDYLVKPVDLDELKTTLARLKPASTPWEQVMEVLKQSIQPVQSENRKIVLRDQQSIYVVSVSSIIRCEAKDNYTAFHFTDQNPIVVSRPLKEYDELLTSLQFVRVHQSHLINLNQVQQFNKRDGGSVKMKDGTEIPVSSRKRDTFLEALSRFS